MLGKIKLEVLFALEFIKIKICVFQQSLEITFNSKKNRPSTIKNFGTYN